MATLGGCSGCLQLRTKGNGSVTIVSTRSKGRGSVFIRCKCGGLTAVQKPQGVVKQGCGCS